MECEPDALRRDSYNLATEKVTDPAPNVLFGAKRDEIARQITALEDRATRRFVQGSLQLYAHVMSSELVDDGLYSVGMDVGDGFRVRS